MNTLLLIERYVLELISVNVMRFEEVAYQSGLDLKVLKAVLDSLIDQKLILLEKSQYRIDFGILNKTDMSKPDSVKKEIEEIFQGVAQTFIEEKKSTTTSNNPFRLRLRKVWLRDEDQRTLENFFINIETFITNLEFKQRSSNESHCPFAEKYVVYWGQSNYKGIVQKTLEAI